MRSLLTNRNVITRSWKRVGRVSRDNTKAKESILEEDLAKNVSLSLHNSFFLNKESKVKGLTSKAKRLQEQREWMQAYEQLKAWEDIKKRRGQLRFRVHQDSVPRIRGARTEQGVQRFVLDS